MEHVFVSYSRGDEDVARPLAESVAKSGLPVWLAGNEIDLGSSVAEQVQHALNSASVVVLLIGAEPSNWARYEWSQALQRAWTEGENFTLVPVLLPGAEAPAFLSGQPSMQLEHRSADWDVLARAIARSKDVFRWHPTTEGSAAHLAARLEQLARAAAALGDDASES